MGWPATCDLCGGFDAVWDGVEHTLRGTGLQTGKAYDGGVDLARGAYAAVRHLQPNVVVETGVARGITSRVMLDAMDQNGLGSLYSVDLPPLASGWHAQSAIAIPQSMRARWTYIRGASRRVLPQLFADHGPVSLFIHDSLHTYRNMRWELNTAWPHVVSDGLILSDDVEDNCALSDFVQSVHAEYITTREVQRSGFIAAIRRS